MGLTTTLRVYLLCALMVTPAPMAWASSHLDIRAGYETDSGGESNQNRGDTWVAVTAGKTLTRETEGPLTLSLDLALGATAYARETDSNRISIVVTPMLEYLISPRVAASLALVSEGQLVNDGSQSAWGWSGNLRLREQLSACVSLTEYLSYRDLNARDAEYSGTNAAIGAFLRTLVGERWTLGAGGEYALGDYLGGDTQRAGSTGAGSGRHKIQNISDMVVRDNDQIPVREDEARLSGSFGLDYAWSERLSSGAEYIYTRVIGENSGENQHSVIVSTTYGF